MRVIHNTFYVNNIPRGTCSRLGVSLKTGAIKYLFCLTDENKEFALNVKALLSVDDFRLELSSFRSVIPKNAVKISLGQPVYSHNGVYLGAIKNVMQSNMRITDLVTEKGVIPFSFVQACADAIILRKPLPYPLGQSLPTAQYVTRPLLKEAIKENALIKLTLSLSPFKLYGYVTENG